MSLLSPGVSTRELDFSTYVASTSSIIAGIVGGARRGPRDVQLITSQQQLVDIYGPPSPLDFGVFTAMNFLENGNKVYYSRVCGPSASYAEAGQEDDLLRFISKTEDSIVNGWKIAYQPPTADGWVLVSIYDKDMLVEQHYGDLDPESEFFIEKVINSASKLFDVEFNEEAPLPTETVTLTVYGGNDGIADIEAADIIGLGDRGLSVFANADSYDINVLLIPGYSDYAVIAEGISIAESRGDLLYIIDAPFGLKPQQVLDWSNGAGEYQGIQPALNSSYSSLYWPWCQIYSQHLRDDIWLPPSGFAASQLAYTAREAELWFAPAGLKRGRLPKVKAVEYSASQGERDMLYGLRNVVNPIVNFKNDGIVIWGQKTTQRMPSALDRINVRMLTNHLKKIIAASTAYYVFDPNDPFTWDQWIGMVEPEFEAIKARRGLYDYKIEMGEITVTDSDKANYRMPGKLYYKPTLTAEIIPLDFILMPTGASFGEGGGS